MILFSHCPEYENDTDFLQITVSGPAVVKGRITLSSRGRIRTDNTLELST